MANNMYCLTRILRRQGYHAEYVVDVQDTFLMSQPLWEEAPVTLDWHRLASAHVGPGTASEVAENSAWRPPRWVVTPIDARGSRAVRRARISVRRRRRQMRSRLAEALAQETLAQEIASARLIEQLATYDRLVVCGIRVVEALLSGTPYVFWPHGGEVHILPFRHETPVDHAFARLIQMGVTRADTAGTHDPTIAARLEELGRPAPIPYLPFPVDLDRYSPGEADSSPAKGLRARGNGRRILLLCSRQDFFWKGTDRFARAFASAVKDGAPLYLVISPWGADVEPTRRILADAGVLESVEYLDSAVSKPLLRDLYRVADVVVDQFAPAAAFGTTMLEALSCGTPVLINLDFDAFRARWPAFVPPPVLRASTEEEIADVLCGIGDGSVDIADLGRSGRSWIREHHGPDAARLYMDEPR
jgi:glycosyltransferase involved in cell wall biosynthesis